MLTTYDFIGLVGISLSSICYARVQWQRDYAKHLSYSILNFVATLLLGVSLSKNWNLASFVSNLIWGAISLYGVYRCMKYIIRDRKNLSLQNSN